MDSVAVTRMTAADAAEAIGRRAEVAATARQVLIINVGPSGAVLVRSCSKAHDGYQWVDAASLIRRADCDCLPEPEWLQQARSSRRPPLVLFRVLNPTISEAVDVVDDQPPASLDPVTYRKFEISVREHIARRLVWILVVLGVLVGPGCGLPAFERMCERVRRGEVQTFLALPEGFCAEPRR